MIDFTGAYADIFEDGIVTQPKHESGEYFFDLSEDEGDAKLTKVRISNVPRTSILINLQFIQNKNVVEKLRTVFKEGENFFRLCDYLLIAKEEHPSSIKPYLHFIYIEMKSKNPVKTQIIQQFKGASSFCRYVDAILEYNKDFIAERYYNICLSFALFYFRANKRPLSQEKKKLYSKRVSKKPNTMDDVRKFPSKVNPTFLFKDILEGI